MSVMIRIPFLLPVSTISFPCENITHYVRNPYIHMITPPISFCKRLTLSWKMATYSLLYYIYRVVARVCACNVYIFYMRVRALYTVRVCVLKIHSSPSLDFKHACFLIQKFEKYSSKKIWYPRFFLYERWKKGLERKGTLGRFFAFLPENSRISPR